MNQLLEHPTPIGHLLLVATDDGLAAVSYRDEPPPSLRAAPTRVGGATVEHAAAELDQYFAGQRHAFTIPLDWRLTSGFRRVVLQELLQVPYGASVTYGELARMAGAPGAARAVGGAMATNPLAVVVPCHRVLASNGRIGGYSGGDGLDTKRALLALEGAALAV